MEVAARPVWMNDEFLSNCVINSKNLSKDSNIDIHDVKLYYAVPKGENYMSIIYRVTVDYHVAGVPKTNGVQNGVQNGVRNGGGNSDCFIIKASHESEELKIMAKEIKIFVKETDMYMNIVPKLTQTLENAGIEGHISCRCLYSVEGERDVLVMEDLKQQGYILANRLTGLDLAHCKLVLDKQAKMHAASMHYFNTHELSEMYCTSPLESQNNETFEKTMKLFNDSIHKKVANVIVALNKNPKYGKQTIDFFTKYNEVLSEMVIRIFKHVPGNKFNAILHGDCWVNNMMFKYNTDGSVDDVVFIDFQISYKNSVANDFIYFFLTSTNKEVKKHSFGDLQKFYMYSLAKYLNKMGFEGDIPTVEEFEAELKRVVLYAIFLLTHANSIILAEHDAESKDRSKAEVFEMKDMLEMTNVSKTYQEVLLLSIDVLEENGFFDNFSLLDVMDK